MGGYDDHTAFFVPIDLPKFTYRLVHLLVLAFLSSANLSLKVVVKISQIIEKILFIPVRVLVGCLLVSVCQMGEKYNWFVSTAGVFCLRKRVRGHERPTNLLFAQFL